MDAMLPVSFVNVSVKMEYAEIMPRLERIPAANITGLSPQSYPLTLHHLRQI
jgi:hypothetical protein